MFIQYSESSHGGWVNELATLFEGDSMTERYACIVEKKTDQPFLNGEIKLNVERVKFIDIRTHDLETCSFYTTAESSLH